MTEEEWADYDRRRVDPHYEDAPPLYGLLTEEEWLTSTDPQRMMEVFVGKHRDRKFRLFACACCRDIWGLLRNDQERSAVEVAERFADGEASVAELLAARGGCGPARAPGSYATHDRRWEEMHDAAGSCAFAANRKARKMSTCRNGPQAGLLRDIFGNPFRPARMAACWLTPTVVALASAAYELRLLPSGGLDRQRLAVLSDALEEAGCVDAALLSHLRSAGPHVRGCFVIDLLLGKE